MSNWRKRGQNTYSFCNSYERKYQIVMYLPEYNVMYRWFSNRCFSQLKDWRTGTKFSVWDGILQEGFLLTRTKQRFSQVLSRSPSRSILLVFRSDLRALTAFQTLIPLVPWFRRSARSASAPLVPVVPVPAPVVSRVPRVVRPSLFGCVWKWGACDTCNDFYGEGLREIITTLGRPLILYFPVPHHKEVVTWNEFYGGGRGNTKLTVALEL